MQIEKCKLRTPGHTAQFGCRAVAVGFEVSLECGCGVTLVACIARSFLDARSAAMATGRPLYEQHVKMKAVPTNHTNHHET